MILGANKTALLAYVPAPHRGYVSLFRKYSGLTLGILGPDLINEFKSLVRNLPALDPFDARRMVIALDVFAEVRILTMGNIEEFRAFENLVAPDEDVMRATAERFLPGKEVTFDGSWKLRWDWGASTANRVPEGERVISTNQLDREMMGLAFDAAHRTPDWWRQVGAVLTKEGRVLLAAFNRHVPSEHSAYLQGDPRSNFEPGQYIDVSNAFHAEAGIVAEAARRGLSLEGCDLYVTTFPCPPCAYLCAYSGIRRLYYANGYSLVAGAGTLQGRGVELIRVQI